MDRQTLKTRYAGSVRVRRYGYAPLIEGAYRTVPNGRLFSNRTVPVPYQPYL